MMFLYILVIFILSLLLLLIILTEKSITVVTAYYPLQKNKHGEAKYLEWIKLFFKNVSCPVICFCPQERFYILSQMAGSNVQLIIRDFNSYKMMSDEQMKIWNTFYEKDPEKDIHSPELYAVWGAKQEIVNEAIKIRKADIYIWCDIGAFRTERYGSFKNTYKYVFSEKITCLEIQNTIGGGILAGDKAAWNNFSELYLKELELRPDGKDQNIYRKILNVTNSNIIKAPESHNDPWFYLLDIFS